MNKRLIIYILVGTVVVILAAALFLFRSSDNKMTNQDLAEENKKIQEAKTIKFEVVRVLPSGFSPKEVTIEKGMIVRFTNPLDKEVLLKWEGDTQYTSEAVIKDADIATKVFDKEGEYIFSDNSSKNTGKVIVK